MQAMSDVCSRSHLSILSVFRSFSRRAREQFEMEEFLAKVVWPGVARDRLTAMRLVLHNSPFKVRCVADVLKMPFPVEAILVKVDADFTRRGMAPLTGSERDAFTAFVLKTRAGESSFIEADSLNSFNSTSSIQEPSRRLRRLG